MVSHECDDDSSKRLTREPNSIWVPLSVVQHLVDICYHNITFYRGSILLGDFLPQYTAVAELRFLLII